MAGLAFLTSSSGHAELVPHGVKPRNLHQGNWAPVAAPPCPPSTGCPGADTARHPALYLCLVCAQTRLLSQKGPRGPVKTGMHSLPPGLRLRLSLCGPHTWAEPGGRYHLGHSAQNHTGQCNQAKRAGERPEDLQWVKPHSPHPGACHLPQAGIACGVPPVQSSPPEPLEGRQGPILSQEAGETCTRTSGRTERQSETGPCPSQAQPSPSAPASRWTALRKARTRRTLRVGWWGPCLYPGAASLTLAGDRTPVAHLPGAPHPAGPTPSGTLGLGRFSVTRRAASSQGQSLLECFPEIPVKLHSAVQLPEAWGEVSPYLPPPPVWPSDAGRGRWPQMAWGWW